MKNRMNKNSIDYVLVGDYYIPDLKLPMISRNGEKLQATLTNEQKVLFPKYTGCMREYQTMAECLLFQNSFKLGARMMLEVMDDNERINEAGCYFTRGGIQSFVYYVGNIVKHLQERYDGITRKSIAESPIAGGDFFIMCASSKAGLHLPV